MQQTTPQWKSYLMALAFVCFGVALGISMDRWYLYIKAKEVQTMFEKGLTLNHLIQYFSTQLQLSPKQHKQFKKLLKTHLEEGLSLLRNPHPEVRKFLRKGMGIRWHFREAVRKLLNDRQKEVFNDMVQKSDRQRFELYFQRLRFLKKQITSKKKASRPSASP